jgi:hypothetical protein
MRARTRSLLETQRPGNHRMSRASWSKPMPARGSSRSQFGQFIDVCITESESSSHRPVLYRCAATRSSTDRSGHRPGARLPTSARRATARRLSHITEQYSNNLIEADRSRLKSRLRPMRGLKRLRSARIISVGHAFIRNITAAITDSALMSICGTGSRKPSPSSLTLSEPSTAPSDPADQATEHQCQRASTSGRRRFTIR